MTDYEKALKLSELEKAARQCAKGLTYKSSVSGYLIDSLSKNNRLRNEIINGNYKISEYMKFVITEPKRREICATRMRDRVWQKSMCNNGLRDDLLRSLIYDNGACQRKKGVDFAIDRTICFLQKYYREHGSNTGYYDHLDIKGYFPNTPHEEAKRTIRKYVKDQDFVRHVEMLIDSFEDKREEAEIQADPYGKRGIALGSEISQHIELALPSDIDHAIKEKLKVRHLIRFNDDILVISESKEELDTARQYIIDAYASRGLTVTIKQKHAKLTHGVKFLKRRIILTDTGKAIVKADPKKFSKERQRLRKMKAKLDAGDMTMEKIMDHYQSTRAGLDRCDEKAKVKSLDRFFEDLFGAPPPKRKKGKRNAYSKTKQHNREARGRARKNRAGKQKTARVH